VNKQTNLDTLLQLLRICDS